MSEPCLGNGFLAEHIAVLQSSFLRLTGKHLGGSLKPLDAAALYNAPFVILSHDHQPDPIFTYGNLCAQRLFEMSWDELTKLPSRLSAELPNQAERSRLLHQVKERGYISHYEGVRISRTGRRFIVRGATVWNLYNDAGMVAGQAATFDEWEAITSP